MQFACDVFEIAGDAVATDQIMPVCLICICSTSDQRKKKANSGNGNIVVPIPFYLIDGFSSYECQGRNSKAILDNLASKDKINHLIKLYTKVCKMHPRQMKSEHDVEYLKMLKMDIDYITFGSARDTIIDIMA